MPTLTSDQWNTETLRATVFFDGQWPSDRRPGLDAMFGVEIEEETVRGSTKDRTQVASLGTGRIHLQLAQGRCDLIWMGLTVSPDEDPNLGEVSEALSRFIEIVGGAFSGANIEFSRLALGALLAVPFDEKAQVYDLIRKIYPQLNLGAADVEDFLFQINYPLRINNGGTYHLNRLRKVVAREAQVAGFQVTPAGIVALPSPSKYALAYELDFNSRPGQAVPFIGESVSAFYQIAGAEIGKLLGELAND